MGSWSISCGISNIAITSGRKCVLLPLKENTQSEMGGYIPACLPIFGEYDDYGGIENIEHDENTKLLEEHLGIKIDDLAVFLVDGEYTYQRSEVKKVQNKLNKKGTLKEVETWRFMWIDRDVYEFMITNLDDYHKGYMDYGTDEMLKLLGFTFVSKSDRFKNYDPKRFNRKWKKGKVYVYSDGKYLLSSKGSYIYHYGKGSETSIETYFEVPEELHYLQNCAKHEAWKIMSKHDRLRNLGYILGIDRFGLFAYEDIMEEISEKLGHEIERDPKLSVAKKPQPIERLYFEQMDKFGDKIAGLINLRLNLRPMSGAFRPHELYLTPQCGEFDQHQKLLDKFAEINRQHIYVEEED